LINPDAATPFPYARHSILLHQIHSRELFGVPIRSLAASYRRNAPSTSIPSRIYICMLRGGDNAAVRLPARGAELLVCGCAVWCHIAAAKTDDGRDRIRFECDDKERAQKTGGKSVLRHFGRAAFGELAGPKRKRASEV